MTAAEFAIAYPAGLVKLQRYLIRRGLSCPLAEEFAQAAWARAWERLDQLRVASMLGTWVTAIALNLYRESRRKPALYDALEFDERIFHQEHAPPLDVEHIQAVARPEDWELLCAHYMAGRSCRDLAAAAGRAESTMRVRLLRARERTRERMLRKGF